MSEAPLVKEAYEIAKAQLYNQKGDLRNVRIQASLTAALSGLVATFFARVVDSSKLTNCVEQCTMSLPILTWLILGTFILSLYFSSRAFLGWSSCNFELSPRWDINKDLAGESETVVLRELARDADRYFDDNEHVIKDAMGNLRTSMSLVFGQILAWMIILVS